MSDEYVAAGGGDSADKPGREPATALIEWRRYTDHLHIRATLTLPGWRSIPKMYNMAQVVFEQVPGIELAMFMINIATDGGTIIIRPNQDNRTIEATTAILNTIATLFGLDLGIRDIETDEVLIGEYEDDMNALLISTIFNGLYPPRRYGYWGRHPG